MRGLTFTGFALRFVFALVLVLGTYNPSGFSFYHWVASVVNNGDNIPLVGISGILLAIGWVIYIRATIRSLGVIGVSLLVALFAFLIWAGIDMGMLNLDNPSAFAGILLVILALILAVGMSWSHIRRRISGQADMDDVGQ